MRFLQLLKIISSLHDNKKEKRAQENDKKWIKLKKRLDEPGHIVATVPLK